MYSKEESLEVAEKLEKECDSIFLRNDTNDEVYKNTGCESSTPSLQFIESEGELQLVEIKHAEECGYEEISPKYSSEEMFTRAEELSRMEIFLPQDNTLCPVVEKVEQILDNEKLENITNKRKLLPTSAKEIEESAYRYALEIMTQEKLQFLDNMGMLGNVSRYNGLFWQTMSDEQLKSLVYQHITESDKYENENIDTLCKNIVMYIKYEMDSRYVEGEHFSEADFRKIQNRVVFKNCVYDARTGKVHEFDESLPYYFAVDAEYIEADKETPYYDKIKYDATDGDEESMEMFDLMIAYLMIPNRSAKCFFVMANARDSGKSLLGSFLADMYVGNRTKSIDPEHLAGRFSFANVTECVLLSCLEMNTDRLKKTAVSQFKLITGEKRIRSEAKYKNEQTIPIRFKLLLATNGGIVLPEGMADAAFYRRVIVIPFIKSTPLDRLISNLDKKLQSEKDAILSKCIRKLETHIGKDGGIVFPESKLSMQMKEKWMGGVCLDDEFIQSAFEYTGDTKSRVALEDVEMIYRAFIERKGQDKGAIIITDRKNLVAKIKNVHVGADKDKMRTKVIKRNNQKVSTNAICRIKWNQDFLEELGFY